MSGAGEADDPTRPAPPEQVFARFGEPASRGLAGRFGRYTIKGELGRGGMGAVYRARKDGAERDVALKVILDADAATPEELRRFEREIRLGDALDHPGIVAVLDAGTEAGKRWFTMELVEGASFSRLALPLGETVRVLERIARAVAHAHRHGVVHRDLKPGNVIVPPDLQPKVLDFGLAKSLDRESRLSKTGTVLGTASYMAPEQADGRVHETGPATDVWALGVMLYEVIAGRLPFKAPSLVALIGKIMNAEPPHPRSLSGECPAALAAVALRALEKDPAARYPDAGAFADELARWLESGAVAAGGRGRLRHFLRSRKRGLVASAIVLAAAGVATGYLLRARSRRLDLEQRARDVAAAIAEGEAALADFERTGDEPSRTLVSHVREVAGPAAPVAAGEEPAPAADELAAVALALEGAALSTRPGSATDADLPVLLVAERFAPTSERVRDELVRLLLERGSPDRALPRAFQAVLARPWRAASWAHLARASIERADPLAPRPASETGERSARELAFERAEAKLATQPGLAIFDLRGLDRGMKDLEGALRVGRALLRAERGHEALAQAARFASVDPRFVYLRAEAALIVSGGASARAAFEDAAAAARPGSFLAMRARLRAARLAAAPEPIPAETLRAWLRERPGDPLVAAALADPKECDAAETARLVRASRTASRIARRYPVAGAVDAERARAILDIAEKLDPAALGPIVEHERQRWERGEPAKARDRSALTRAADAHDASAEALLAETLRDEPAKARALADRALADQAEPQLAALAHAVKGLSLAEKPAEAVSELDAAIALWATLERSKGQDAVEVAAWRAKAIALAALGRDEEAARATGEADVRAKPDRLRAGEFRATGPYFETLADTGQDDVAGFITSFDARLARDPFQPEWNGFEGLFLLTYYGAVDLGDPWLFVGRSVRRDPSQLNGFDRRRDLLSALRGLIAPPPGDETPTDDEDALWAEIARRSFHLLMLGAAAEKTERDDLRRLLEHAIALDPAQVAAVAARGYLNALDLRQDLALEDEARSDRYFASSQLCRLARALAEVCGEDTQAARKRAKKALDRVVHRERADEEQRARAELLELYPVLRRFEKQ